MDLETATLVAWAGAAGRHALPLFAVMVLLLCLAAWGAWWLLHHRHVEPWIANLSPSSVLTLWLIGGFGVILLGAMSFAELAEELHAGEAMGLADQALTDALREHVPPWALLSFKAVTHLADPITVTLVGVLVAVALLWQRHRLMALAWSLALGGNAVLNPSLKAVFERVRPQHADGLVIADGFSFPSGHSSCAVVGFGMMAYVALRLLPLRWHLPILMTAVVLAFTVGCSRVFLRVHFASDVAAGFATGAAWLAVCVAGAELTRFLRQRRPGGGPASAAMR